MSSAKLPGRLCLLADRMITQLERTMVIHETDDAKSSGLGFLPQQLTQLSQAVSFMRKEARETAKSPLEEDREAEKSEEEVLQELLSALSEDDLLMLLEMKKEEKCQKDRSRDTQSEEETPPS